MGRTIRLNTSGGGASSTTSGISLDDVENAFFTRRKLQEIKLDSTGLNAIEFPNLDTETYDTFHIRCSRVHTQYNTAYIFYGGMEGTSRITQQSWSASGFYGSTFFNNNSSGESYTFGQNTTLDDADESDSFKVFEFNLYFPDPSSANAIPNSIVGDYTFWHAMSGGYQGRSGWGNWRMTANSETPNGFYLRNSNGNFTEDDTSPSIYTIYGTKRRKSN